MMDKDRAIGTAFGGTIANVIELQRMLVGHDVDEWLDTQEQVDYLGLLALHTHTEVNEALDHVEGWKGWAGGRVGVNTEPYRSEVADIILLAISAYVCSGGDGEELVGRLNLKSGQNLHRAIRGNGGK